MNAYVDSSVLLRIVLNEKGRLAAWPRITGAWTSDLARVECFRVVDRGRVSSRLADDEVAKLRSAIDQIFESIEIVPVDRRVLRRAAEPMPTALRTLDAIHIASALALRSRAPGLQLATHDDEMAIAAESLGFRVLR